MTDLQIENLMLAHYSLWLAFTCEIPYQATDRWRMTQNALGGFANERRKVAKA